MNYKKQLTVPLMLLSLSILSFGTVYFDGEDGTVGDWKVHDNKPAGAVIENSIDDNKSSKVIEFKGDARRNSYMLGSRNWNNRTEKHLKWSMNFSEKFKITVYIKTKKGVRTLFYDYKNSDKGLYQKRYIKFGLGSKSMNGTWQNFSRDIEADLKKYEPDNELVKIKGMKIQGSGRMDDIRLEKKGDTNPCITRKELDKKIKNIEELRNLNTSCIKDMSKLFFSVRRNHNYSPDVSKWDVSNVTNMSGMFWGANFNPDVSKWDVSNVKFMPNMFRGAEKFNQPIGGWNVSNVLDMNSMFNYATSFNQDISKWDVSSVVDMSNMFPATKAFRNHDLSKWNVERVSSPKNFSNYYDAEDDKNNINPNWNSNNTPEEAILTKAKEFCIGSKKSEPKFTENILCPFEDNNLAYLLYEKFNEPRVHDDVEYLVTASLDGTTDDFHILTSNNANNDRVGYFTKWITNSSYPGLRNAGLIQYRYFFKNAQRSAGFLYEVLSPLLFMGTTSVESINLSDDKKTLTLTWKVVLNPNLDKRYKIKDINKTDSSPYYKHVYDMTDIKRPKAIKLENIEVNGDLTLSSYFNTYKRDKD